MASHGADVFISVMQVHRHRQQLGYPGETPILCLFLLLQSHYPNIIRLSFHAVYFKLSIAANETAQFDVPSPPKGNLLDWAE